MEPITDSLTHTVTDTVTINPTHSASTLGNSPHPDDAPTASITLVKTRAVNLSHDQILAATASCLFEEGYEKTTIRRIAARLGCAVGSIYRYFDDKRQLLLAVTQKDLEPVVILLDAGGDVARSVEMYHHHATQAPEAYRLMFWLSNIGAKAGEANLPPVVQQIIDRWAVMLGTQQQAMNVWAALHGAIALGQDLASMRRTVDQADRTLQQVAAVDDRTDDPTLL